MAARKTHKMMYYFRAVNEGRKVNLQALLLEAKRKKRSIGSTEITFGAGDIIRIQRQSSRPGTGHAIQLSRYTPGERAPTLKPSQDIEGTQKAPSGFEFKDGDCFLLMKAHNVLFLGLGITHQRANAYLLSLFKECGFDAKKRLFTLKPATNIDKIKMLQQDGVRSIELSTNAFALSIPKDKRKGWFSKGLGKLSDELKPLIAMDESISEQKAREDLLVDLELRLDGNTRASTDAHQLLEDIAEDLIDEPSVQVSNFQIVTQKGGRIGAESVRMQMPCKLTIVNKSASPSEAWEAMDYYLEELESKNLHEQ